MELIVSDTAWDKLESEKANVQPTAAIGETVQWFDGNDQRSPRAGICIGVEEPGRITIKVLPMNGFPQDKKCVYHTTSDVHKKPNNQMTVRHGSWDFPRGVVPEGAYAEHEAAIERREKFLTDAARKEELIQENKAKLVAEQQAAPKRRLPDPIAAIKRPAKEEVTI